MTNHLCVHDRNVMIHGCIPSLLNKSIVSKNDNLPWCSWTGFSPLGPTESVGSLNWSTGEGPIPRFPKRRYRMRFWPWSVNLIAATDNRKSGLNDTRMKIKSFFGPNMTTVKACRIVSETLRFQVTVFTGWIS